MVISKTGGLRNISVSMVRIAISNILCLVPAVE